MSTQEMPLFHGAHLDPKDFPELHGDLKKVRDLMLDGVWRTLDEIREKTSIPQASASAHLRYLRTPRFGNYTVERVKVGKRLFKYKVTAPTSDIANQIPARTKNAAILKSFVHFAKEHPELDFFDALYQWKTKTQEGSDAHREHYGSN
jgi:hypothetical protein